LLKNFHFGIARRFVSGHGFSRAETPSSIRQASAPALSP
jgi:hypothetical protein